MDSQINEYRSLFPSTNDHREMGKKTPKINSHYCASLPKGMRLSINNITTISNWFDESEIGKLGKFFPVRLESLKAPLQVIVTSYKVREKYI